MPINVGIDLVEIDEIEASLRTHGDRYLTRIYTQLERLQCGSDPRLLAVRFAAKEAAMKALGRHDEPLSWQSIELRSGDDGRLSLELSGRAAEMARDRNVTDLAISIGHRPGCAAALVLTQSET